MRFWCRLRRLTRQSRIRLPRPALQPGDVHLGDRLQIGTSVFRFRGCLPVASGPLVFDLDELDGGLERRPVRLVGPAESPGSWTWSGANTESALPPSA